MRTADAGNARTHGATGRLRTSPAVLTAHRPDAVVGAAWLEQVRAIAAQLGVEPRRFIVTLG